jgi:hypothetical protein
VKGGGGLAQLTLELRVGRRHRPSAAAPVVALHGEETGEGKGANRWARATVSRFESIQTSQVIQTLFEF